MRLSIFFRGGHPAATRFCEEKAVLAFPQQKRTRLPSLAVASEMTASASCLAFRHFGSAAGRRN